jgi:hypothetical protein
MGNSSSKKSIMNQRASTVSLLSISSRDRRKKRNKNDNYVYSEVILSLLEPSSSMKISKSPIGSFLLPFNSNRADVKRGLTSNENNLCQKTSYLLKPKSARGLGSNFKVVIRGNLKVQIKDISFCNKIKSITILLIYKLFYMSKALIFFSYSKLYWN